MQLVKPKQRKLIRAVCAAAIAVYAVAIGVSKAGLARYADQLPSCVTPPGAARRAFPDELPVPVLKALNAKLGDVAAPGEPFDDTDVIITGRDRRAVFVWERGQSWIIATEHSEGWYYSNPVLSFDLSADGVSAVLVRATTASPGTLCATATKLLEAK